MELFWEAFREIWKVGAHSGWRFLGALVAILYIIQILWTLWRWVDDAETREESSEDDTEHVKVSERRRVFCGDLLDVEWLGPWKVQRHESVEFYIHIFMIIGVGGGVAIAVWPFLLIFGIVYGLLRAARGSRRLQKTVSRMAKSLKGKSNKDHNHNETYVLK